MRPSTRSLLFFSLLLNFIIVCSSPASAQYVIGETGPNFTLPDLEGNPVDLYDFQEQIIVVNFFATWCPGCNEESTQLQHDVYEAYADQGVVVVGIDLLESAELVEQWRTEMGLTYPILLAPDWTLFQQFPTAGGIPYNAIFDRDMILQYAQYGFDLDNFTEVIDHLLDSNAVNNEPATWGGIKAIFK